MKKDGYDGERSFAYANRVAEEGAGRIFMKNADPKAAPDGLKKVRAFLLSDFPAVLCT